MRIAVNLLPFRSQLAGAGRYTQHILRELVCAESADEYIFFVMPAAAPHFAYGMPNITTAAVALPDLFAARIAYEQMALPLQISEWNCDVLFTPSVAVPLVGSIKKVTVIYDMIAEHRQGRPRAVAARRAAPTSPLPSEAMPIIKYPAVRNGYVRWMSRYAARHSDAIITISQNSRQEIARLAGVRAEKIRLAPPGVDPVLRPITDPAALARVRQKYRLPERFVLYLGTLEPGKNLVRLVQAFAQMKREYPGLGHQLVLAGAAGWGGRELDAAIRQSHAAVHRIGFVADRDLAAVYSLAEVFVYPSLYEGFGMPPLEAMACGTPVIVSNVSALPEVVGNVWAGPEQNAGLLVSPYDVRGWTHAMARVLQDRALHARLRAAGLGRAHLFRWDDSAAVVRAALHAV